MARATFILDTSVIIDWLTKLPAAITWLESMDASQAGISSITVMEALSGARNKQEMASIGRSLSRFEHIHFLHQDSKWAIRQFRTFWLSHQIEIADCIIGAIAARTSLPLYTLNISDFDPLPDVNALKPY